MHVIDAVTGRSMLREACPMLLAVAPFLPMLAYMEPVAWFICAENPKRSFEMPAGTVK